MTQRQVLVDPANSYEAYKAVQRGEVVQRPLALHTLFSEMKDNQRNNLTYFYLQDLDNTITQLQQNNCLYAEEARKFYGVLTRMHTSNRRSFEFMQFPPEDLVNLIHATKALITTPLMQDGKANPQFSVRVNNFDTLIYKYKQARRDNLFDGVVRSGNALIAAAFTALVVLLSVIGTFGVLSVAAVAVGGFIIAKQGAQSAGHFSVAAKQKTMFDAMQPLATAVNSQRKTMGR